MLGLHALSNYDYTLCHVTPVPLITICASSITAPQDSHKRLVLQIVEWLTGLLSWLARHELTIYITKSA